MTGDELLEALLRPPTPAACADAHASWAAQTARAGGLGTIDAAIVGGLHADRLAWAFLAGYQAALRALDPSLPEGALVSLCATEARGAHPRDIETTARREGGDLVLDGEKWLATLAAEAAVLLVVASGGWDPEGRNRLLVARVPADALGVSRAPLPAEVPFVPEISHLAVRLAGVRVPESAVLPGDGYEDALKPFRSLEDAHVFAACLAYLCGVAGRCGWPAGFRERAMSVALAMRALAEGSRFRSPSSHVALGGVLALGREVVEASEAHWERAGEPERARWRRDRPLLEVAGRARTARLKAAWRRCGAP